jgi:hypothetical protein
MRSLGLLPHCHSAILSLLATHPPKGTKPMNKTTDVSIALSVLDWRLIRQALQHAAARYPGSSLSKDWLRVDAEIASIKERGFAID